MATVQDDCVVSGGDAPPKFVQGKTSFNTWKRDVAIWRLGTNIKPARQGARVIRALSGQVKEHCSRMSLDRINQFIEKITC